MHAPTCFAVVTVQLELSVVELPSAGAAFAAGCGSVSDVPESVDLLVMDDFGIARVLPPPPPHPATSDDISKSSPCPDGSDGQRLSTIVMGRPITVNTNIIGRRRVAPEFNVLNDSYSISLRK